MVLNPGSSSHDMRQDEYRQKDKQAEPVGDEPAVAKDKGGRDPERHANQPRDAGEDEIAEEEPDQHEDRPEQDVEQKLVAGQAPPMQAVALEGEVGEHPQGDG